MGGHGDNLMTAAVLPHLAQTYRMEVITNKPCGDVFINNPYIEKLTFLKEDDLPAGCGLDWQQYFAKRSHEYEFFANLSHSCESLVALSPVQTQFYWPQEWRQWWCGRSYLEMVADVVGAPHEFQGPLYFPTEEEMAKAIETKKKVGPRCIGWVVAGSRLDKFYPHSALAISRLIKELNTPVIMFGGYDREMQVSEQVMKFVEQINSSHENLHEAMTRKDAKGNIECDWPVRRSYAQLMQCDLVIGPDTGNMWAVAFEDMPKIVMLSHASEENITKYWKDTVALHADPQEVKCQFCHRLHDDPKTCLELSGRKADELNGAACMDNIKVETIIQTARRLLNGKKVV